MKQRSVKAGAINIAFIAITVLTTVLLFLTSYRSAETYRRLTETVDKQNILQQAAYDLKQGSDYLTEQVRLFVETGDTEYSDAFFTEMKETRRRDLALESIAEYVDTTAANEKMEAAMANSNELVQVEFYTFRLAARAYGIPLERFPEEIRNVALSERDLSLSPEEQLEKARDLVFGPEYQASKARINSEITGALDRIMSEARIDQENLSRRYSVSQTLETGAVFVMLVAILIFIYIVTRLLISPLQEISAKILRKDFLPMRGAEEIQRMAATYNEMFFQLQKDHLNLSYEATHDALTGLYNRKVFDSLRDDEKMNGATLIFLDIDYFKGINDTYGHDVGDKVLKKMAKALSDNFRSEDYPCRIGGDEFAVVMLHVDSSLKHVVESKVRRISRHMNDTSDGLPYNSISVGIAFPDRPNRTESIFTDADAALYRAKEAGRNTYRFYE